MSNENVNANANAIALYNDENAVATIAKHNLLDIPSNQFELDTKQELMRLDAELDSVSLRMVQSKELVGVVFDVVDAMFTTINVTENGQQVEKLCVNFIIELESGERVTCLKGSNKFNNVYANAFNGWRGIAEKRLEGMTFETDSRWQKAGNPAIVLRKAKPQMKAVNKAK